jgi:Virulence factor BrkB
MLGAYFGHLLPLPTVALEAINFAISFAVITGLFALTFKLLPDVKVAWRDVWLGAAVTSLLFTAGQLLIGLYLGTSGCGLGVRCGRLAGGHSCVGVVLGADPVPGHRVHQGLDLAGAVEASSRTRRRFR